MVWLRGGGVEGVGSRVTLRRLLPLSAPCSFPDAFQEEFKNGVAVLRMRIPPLPPLHRESLLMNRTVGDGGGGGGGRGVGGLKTYDMAVNWPTIRIFSLDVEYQKSKTIVMQVTDHIIEKVKLD